MTLFHMINMELSQKNPSDKYMWKWLFYAEAEPDSADSNWTQLILSANFNK